MSYLFENRHSSWLLETEPISLFMVPIFDTIEPYKLPEIRNRILKLLLVLLIRV